MKREERRRFLLGVAGAGGSALLAACATPAAPKTAAKSDTGLSEKKQESAEEEVSAAEDLMREHGVLNRVLLVYDESAHRLEAQQPVPLETIASAAEIIRRFIEDYHEKLEEDFIFPRFEKAGRHGDLTATLRQQHRAGRLLTERVLTLAKGSASPGDRRTLASSLRTFARMYRPHEAREDTVLFPALRGLMTPKELDALGEQFEDKEHELFGKEGFEGIVARVAELERALGIHDLAQFTPEAT